MSLLGRLLEAARATRAWLNFGERAALVFEEVTEDLRASELPPPLPDRYSEAPVPLSAKDVERQRALAKQAARAGPPPRKR